MLSALLLLVVCCGYVTMHSLSSYRSLKLLWLSRINVGFAVTAPSVRCLAEVSETWRR